MTPLRLAGLTQEKIQQLEERDLAELASHAPDGFTAVFWNGRFSFVADSVMAELGPSRRAEVTVVGRMH